MVNKKVQNEVPQKEVKKKGRRLKRSVRKTFGALFLASAIAVAAIPTDGLQAAVDENNGGTPVKEDVFEPGKIPLVEKTARIYSYPMGNCTFRFAYVDMDTGYETTDNPVAVILGFTVSGSLDGGELKIPETMEAYRRYSKADSDATSSNVAVNLEGKFLFYKRTQQKRENGQLVWQTGEDGAYLKDADGNLIPVYEDVYEPCYYNTHATWAKDSMFYVQVVGDDGSITYEESSPDQRIASAKVGYIGSQYLEYDAETGEWNIADDGNNGKITKETQGVFYNNTYITTLTVSDSVMGIGDYAFVGCNFTTVSFGNNLGCIGNYAFARCARLTNMNFDLSCPVTVLGEYCFSGCVSLPSINIPGAVQKLGDGAFEGCTSLRTVNLIHPGKDNNPDDPGFPGSLTVLGRSVFKGCSALSGLEFPVSYTGTVDVSEFEGCSSLAYIKANNAEFDLKEGDLKDFGYDRAVGSTDDKTSTGSIGFKQTVPSTFYLEGPEAAALHKKAQEQRIAYKFYSSEFERNIYELRVDDGDYTALYQVSTPEGRILKCEMDEGMDTLTLPETLGPQTIVGIDVPTFQNMCFLKTITIPASVNYIAAGAFMGCHNLKNVIFTDAEKCKEIGDGAFSTQEFTALNHECKEGLKDEDSYLYFVGTISPQSRPFTYAMSPGEYVNSGSKYRTYITYYSGWPTNLEVKYNETTGLNELVGYPTLYDYQSTSDKYTHINYVYMTGDYETAAKGAYESFRNGSMDKYQEALINAARDIVLPDGIQSIAYVDAEGTPVAVRLDDTGNIISEDSIAAFDDDDNGIQGLFSYKEAKENTLPGFSKTLTAYSIGKIGESAFKDCDKIGTVVFSGPLTAVGNYAFEDCDLLNIVSLSESIKEMGLRPFTNCKTLLHVNFNGSETFSEVDSIIYKSNSNGKTLVEYLYGRSSDVDADELEGVTEIYPEAFMSTMVSNVDFTGSSITDVPEDAFRETRDLYSVTLPETCKSISINAFTDSYIRRLHIPASVTYVDNDICQNINAESPYTSMTDLTKLIVYTPEGSAAWTWAEKKGVEKYEEYNPKYWTVAFYDDWEHMYEPTHLICEVQVEDGHDGDKAYQNAGFEKPVREGYEFDRWSNPVSTVTNDMATGAVFKEIDTTVTITFYDRDFEDTESVTYKVLRVDENIPYGGSVPTPSDPKHDGYTFVGWLNGIVNKDKPGYMGPFTKDTQIYAQYEKGDSQNGSGSGGDGTGNGGSGNGNGSGSGGDGTGNGGSGNGGGSGSDGTGGSSSTTFYVLTVQNGSGSGSYPEGSQPVIIANDPASGQVFDHWTVSPSDVKIASTVLSASIITMPASDVTVTAHYKAGSSGSGGTTGSGNNTQRPSSGTVTNGGTTVVIDKNGLSNTGVVSATVNGSSDNFTIKITESDAATEAALRALLAEYGSLDHIKYFPMDISLYDSTGTYKITDTTGISVTITLPLPDSLITYAGNNRAASVVNDRLERLSARFTTIQGVSCITFTAEHFSPYVIYVNTGDLSSGEVSDSTPKTGDFIHPKWFLSIALACMSFVLFMQKDARKPKKVKVKVKAR